MSSETEQLLESFSESEKNAIKVIQTFIGLYSPMNQGNGVGLFSGMKRHENLVARIPNAAMSSYTLLEFWSKLREKMLVGLPPMKADKMLISLWSLPNQREVIRYLRKSAFEFEQIARQLQSSLSAAKKAEWEAIQKEQEVLEKALENETALTELKAPVETDNFSDKEIPFGNKETGGLL